MILVLHKRRYFNLEKLFQLRIIIIIIKVIKVVICSYLRERLFMHSF